MANKLDVEIRECKKCKKTKPIGLFTQFTYEGVRYFGRICRACRTEDRREYYKNNKELFKKHFRASYERNKDIYKKYEYNNKARKAVRNAVAGGKFVKEPCKVCTNPKSEFHHTHGYDEPNWFRGEWLCRQHHKDVHQRLKEAEYERQHS